MKWKIFLALFLGLIKSPAVTLDDNQISAAALNSSSAVQRHNLGRSGGFFSIPKSSGVYRIVHSPTGREYIGSAKSLRSRAAIHRHGLKTGKHHNKHLLNAVKKYGISQFYFEVVEITQQESLISREQFYIDLKKPAFNVCRIAGSVLGRKHREETRRAISRSHMGKKHIEETKELIRKIVTGRKHTDESRRKMSILVRARGVEWIEKMRDLAMRRTDKWQFCPKGIKVSDSTRAKISKSLLGHPVSKETRRKMSKAKRGKPWSEAARKAHADARTAKLLRLSFQKQNN